jgi:hypothetical protein
METYSLDAYGSRWGPIVGCCENGNEPSGSIKGVEFLDYLSDLAFQGLCSNPGYYGTIK